MGVSKHMGASKCMGAYGYHPQSDKACFICFIKHMGASKHTGGCPNLWGHPVKWVFATKSIYLKSDHHQILSRKIEMRFCSSSSRQNIA